MSGEERLSAFDEAVTQDEQIAYFRVSVALSSGLLLRVWKTTQ